MRILHITYGFNGGGVGFVIANYCTGIRNPQLQFDIVGENTGKEHLLQERFEKAGFHVHYITPKAENLFGNIMDMMRLLKNGHYDAVHVHMEEWSFLYLGLAKFYGIPVRICHAHMAYRIGSKEKPHYWLFRRWINRWSTFRLACSTDAGRDLFRGYPFLVLNNAIPVAKYRFRPQQREETRRKLGVEGQFVVGNVGRLSYQKNPQFTVTIFKHIHNRYPQSVLVLVGTGELEAETKALVQQYGLHDKVMFLGLRSDVPDLLQALDAFVLPSRFEGLGMVYVEAQAAGLKTFATDELVPKAACIKEDLMTFMSQHSDAEAWAEAILNQALHYTRRDTSSEVAQKGYDLDTEIPKLEALYLSLQQCPTGMEELDLHGKNAT